MEIRANVDYSSGWLARQSDVISCVHHSDGKLRVITRVGDHYVFNEIVPNHWIRTDSDMNKPFDTGRFS